MTLKMIFVLVMSAPENRLKIKDCNILSVEPIGLCVYGVMHLGLGAMSSEDETGFSFLPKTKVLKPTHSR